MFTSSNKRLQEKAKRRQHAVGCLFKANARNIDLAGISICISPARNSFWEPVATFQRLNMYLQGTGSDAIALFS